MIFGHREEQPPTIGEERAKRFYRRPDFLPFDTIDNDRRSATGNQGPFGRARRSPFRSTSRPGSFRTSSRAGFSTFADRCNASARMRPEMPTGHPRRADHRGIAP